MASCSPRNIPYFTQTCEIHADSTQVTPTSSEKDYPRLSRHTPVPDPKLKLPSFKYNNAKLKQILHV